MKKRHVITTLGFLIAPLAAAISLTAIEVAEGDLDLLDAWTLAWVFIVYCYALGVTLIFGLPAFLLLSRFDKVTWWSAILVGSFSALVMVLVFRGLNAFVVVPVGGASALLFWLIWRWGSAGNDQGNVGPIVSSSE